ncbi:MAG: hypothetical protein MR699_07965, partial [Clostridium sp.]|nr:hypothetical protein [Clostridium sp.]
MIAGELKEAGFAALSEGEKWLLKEG